MIPSIVHVPHAAVSVSINVSAFMLNHALGLSQNLLVTETHSPLSYAGTTALCLLWCGPPGQILTRALALSAVSGVAPLGLSAPHVALPCRVLLSSFCLFLEQVVLIWL